MAEKNDYNLNKTLVDMFTGAIVGYALGAGLSIFFKNKQSIRNIGAGIGAGIFYEKNNGQLRFKANKKCFDDSKNEVKRVAFEEARGVFVNYYGYLEFQTDCCLEKKP